VDSGRRGVYDIDTGTVTATTVLSAVVLAILLIICANIANLMLCRAITRRKEMAVRLSLGATRARLVRQLLTEALVLAFAGAALGLAVASWGVNLLPARISSVTVFHGRTFLFTLLAAVLTSALFGAIPALRTSRVDVSSSLKEAGRGVAGRRNILARALLVVQVALSVVLLVGAGLFLQTLRHLRSVDPGFDPKDLVLVRVNPTLAGYGMPQTVDMYGRLLERFAAIPGVGGAALSQPALLSGSTSMTSIYVEGHAAPNSVGPSYDPAAPHVNRLVVSPGFRRVMGIALLRGRDLTDRDDGSAPMVALVNEAAVRKYFGGGDPLGKHFGSQPENASQIEVVGIVKDARYATPREDPPPTMYMTYRQAPRAVATFELRAAGSLASLAGAVRDAVSQVDPHLPIISISTQTEQIERRFSQERLFAQAYSLFGGIALLLASIGLFGLMSYNVARRTAEMGIRMALGAERRDVVRIVMRESLLLVGIGVAAGLLMAAASARLVAALLYGLRPGDVPTMAAAILVMVGVSAVAAYLPARRASRVDPLVALRYE
jgi:predicted permease